MDSERSVLRRWAPLALFLLASAGLHAPPLRAAPPPDPRAVALIQELGLQQGRQAARDMQGWEAPRRIVVANADAARLAQLQAMAPGVEVLAAGKGRTLRGQLDGAQAVIGLCDAATLASAHSLRWIQAFAAGVEACVNLPGMAERKIVLTNLQRMMGQPIAEHAIALTLALTRGLPRFARDQHAGKWRGDDAERAGMREIGGRTMLVVGLGGIGTEVARHAHALGMRVVATRNSSREGPEFVAKVGLPGELLDLAREADVVVNATPLTPETTGIFNTAFFDAMKPGGYFVNVARGRSVVTRDLVAALRGGRLAGAALDVVDPEPLPAGHPLWSMPNVLITPHVAPSSDAQADRNWLLVAENVRRYAAGEPLLNVVDVARGY